MLYSVGSLQVMTKGRPTTRRGQRQQVLDDFSFSQNENKGKTVQNNTNSSVLVDGARNRHAEVNGGIVEQWVGARIVTWILRTRFGVSEQKVRFQQSCQLVQCGLLSELFMVALIFFVSQYGQDNIL